MVSCAIMRKDRVFTIKNPSISEDIADCELRGETREWARWGNRGLGRNCELWIEDQRLKMLYDNMCLMLIADLRSKIELRRSKIASDHGELK